MVTTPGPCPLIEFDDAGRSRLILIPLVSLQAEPNSSPDLPDRGRAASGGWTLLVPGLERALSVAGSEGLTGLTRMLARAERARSVVYGVHAAVARAILGDAAAMHRWAPAPVMAARECALEPAVATVRLDPVHLVPAGDHLILRDPGPIRREEAESLVGSIGAALGEEPRILAAAPGRWYASVEKLGSATWTAPEAVMGNSIFDALPQGPGAGSLRRLMNEIQMVLHEAPLNEAREQAGTPPINSVWAWGWASGPMPSAPRWPGVVFGKDVYAAGLAELSGGRVDEKGVAPCGEWPQTGLIVCDVPARALRSGDEKAVGRALRQLDRQWAQPLLGALKRRRIRQLRISSEGCEYPLDVRGAWRLWRRRSHDGGEL